MASSVRQEKVRYGKAAHQYYLVLTSEERPPLPGHYAFYFHGGGWTFGRPETFTPAAHPWLAAGYRVIMPSYRRLPFVGLPQIVHDCQCAVRASMAAAAPVRIQLGGLSAGGQLAATLALDPSLWAPWCLRPTAVFCAAAPLDLARLLRQPRLRGALLRAALRPHLSRHDPGQLLARSAGGPTRWLLLHGTADRTVDVAHSQHFAARLRQGGWDSQLRLLPGGNHLAAGRWMFGGAEQARLRQFIAPNLAPSPSR